jgi:hypothetical protein
MQSESNCNISFLKVIPFLKKTFHLIHYFDLNVKFMFLEITLRFRIRRNVNCKLRISHQIYGHEGNMVKNPSKGHQLLEKYWGVPF